MEDVLELSAEPYDPARPVVCFDEASKGLPGDVAEPILPAPRSPAKQDYEYTRHGTSDLFVVEPQAGRRHVTATERRTAADFAGQMRRLCDELYPEAKVSRVVLDDLNTHALGSLFAAYPPAEAWRLARRQEFHFTPEHASWLNMGECELPVLARQCLGRRLTSREAVAAGVGGTRHGPGSLTGPAGSLWPAFDGHRRLSFVDGARTHAETCHEWPGAHRLGSSRTAWEPFQRSSDARPSPWSVSSAGRTRGHAPR